MQPMIGEIRTFAGNFAPRGWALCNGQILPISQYTALFSILGVTYGGNGTSTFALPNLQGSVPLGAGNGPGLTPRVLGEIGGAESVTVLTTEMPAHTHGVKLASNSNPAQATVTSPANAYYGSTDPNNNGATLYSTVSNAAMGPSASQPAGGSQPHNNIQPSLAVSYIICMEGIFPVRG